MAAKKDIVLLSEEDVQSYTGLIEDLKVERALNADGTWNYIARLYVGDAYAGAYLYLDGPLVIQSYGASPTYRQIVFASADWTEERIFSHVGELWDHMRSRGLDFFRYESYARTEAGYVSRATGTMDLRKDVKH